MTTESNENIEAVAEETVDPHSDLSSEGVVYVLKRKSKTPIELCKVGFSTISGDSRAKNYTDGEWAVAAEFKMPVWLAKLTEKATHKILGEYWMDPKISGGTANEVFCCDPELAETAVFVSKEDCIRKAILELNLNQEELIKIVYGINNKKQYIQRGGQYTHHGPVQNANPQAEKNNLSDEEQFRLAEEIRIRELERHAIKVAENIQKNEDFFKERQLQRERLRRDPNGL